MAVHSAAHLRKRRLGSLGPLKPSPLSASRLPCSYHLIFRGSQFFQRERTATVQLLRAHAHLCAEANLPAVGERGRRIQINPSELDWLKDFFGVDFVGGKDCFKGFFL